MNAQVKKEKAATRAKSENAEARTEKVERMCKVITTRDSVVTDSKTMPLVAAENAEVTGEEHPERSTMNDHAGNEETSNETCERHRGRSVLRTVNEDEDFIAIHNDLVGHDEDDGMEENKQNQEEPSGSESTSTEATSTVAVVIARESGDEHSDRNTTKLEADRIKCEGLHARFPHLVAEAGSIVLHVSNNMNEVKKDGEDNGDGEEEGETAAAKETEEISRKDAEIRRLIEERRSTPKEEKQRLKELRKCIKKCTRDKKRVKRQQLIQRILEDFKGVSNIPGIKYAKKKVLITKIEDERGEIITSRRGIANVFGEFYKKLYDDNEQDEHGNESSTDVHNNDTDEMTRIPEITTEELQAAINKLKKRQITRQHRDPSRRHQSMRR